MEFVCQNRVRNRKKRKRHHKRRRYNFEVKLAKQQQRVKNFQESYQSYNIMEAETFWQNYAATQDWQRRHNVVWWRTRCYALEHENNMLKEKIRNLLSNHNNEKFMQTENNKFYSFPKIATRKHITEEKTNIVDHENKNKEKEEEEKDDLVFQITDDMMKFLEQSIRHKMELKKMRESEKDTKNEKKDKNNSNEIEGGKNYVEERVKCAELLYGEASSRVLAMETALHTTNERHIDKARPILWPNIPFNLKFD